MPTNLFDNPSDLRSRMSRNLGFDPSAMIQSQYPQIMADVDVRRRQGVGKYSQDILQQGAQTAAQELENRMKGYDFSKKKEYYDNPATSKMFHDYLERMGFGTNAPVDNPYQIADLNTLTNQGLAQEASRARLAEELIRNQWAGAPTSDLEYARKMIGAPSASGGTNAPVAAPGTTTTSGVTPAPAQGRSAMGVFLNRALPAGVSSAGAIAAGMRTPGPWPVKAGSAAITALVGDRITRMAMGDLTPEDEAAHPFAKTAGDVTGYIGGLISGRKIGGFGKLPLPTGGTAPVPGGGVNVKPGYVPRGHNVNINRGGATGVGGSASRMSKTPYIPPPNPPQPKPGPMRVGGPAPIPMAQPVNTPNLPPQAPIPTGYTIPMGNQPVSTPPISPAASIPGGFSPTMHQPVANPPLPPAASIPATGLPQPFLPAPVGTPGLPEQPPIPLNPQLEAYLRQMMQGPRLPSTGPNLNDPQLQLFIQNLFKKVQPGSVPPGTPSGLPF